MGPGGWEEARRYSVGLLDVWKIFYYGANRTQVLTKKWRYGMAIPI